MSDFSVQSVKRIFIEELLHNEGINLKDVYNKILESKNHRLLN
ncbi:MAG: hypothetical protein M5T52_02610 [Ignavibacteriaceae bacterium]|nr:hypothetical protein [Ignavibacteriaceae bacterium]